MMVTLGILAVMMAAAIPQLHDVAGSYKLGNSLRDVERELQAARLKAVTANRPMRVRFNCPAAGQFRMVELIGTPGVPDAADSATNRCSGTTYPSPPADTNTLTRPNHDGPVRSLDSSVSFGTAATIEFWPDGSAHQAAGTTVPWPVIGTTGTAITLTRKGKVRTITVNGLGKIQLQQ